MANRRRSHLFMLALFAAFPACTSSTSINPRDGGDTGGAIGSGGATDVGTGTGGRVGTGGQTSIATGVGGATGSGGSVGSDAGLGRDGNSDGSSAGDGSNSRDGSSAADAILRFDVAVAPDSQLDQRDSRRDSGTGQDTAKGADTSGSGDVSSPLDTNDTKPLDLAADACTGDVCTMPGAVTRPTYNTGTGFFVTGGKLYDASGVEFRIRGVDKCHYDADWPGIPKTHANTIRWGVPLWLAASVSSKLMQDSINVKIVPMAGVWYTAGTYADADSVTCKEDTAPLTIAVDQWVAQAATFKAFEKYVLINIANEWGPSDSTVWRDAYITAVARLRAAGYLSTLVIDSGGCGQDTADIATYAQTVFDSDPQRNIVFDVHVYGNWSNGGGQSWQTDLGSGLDSLVATGLPIIVGEFGPGRNIGPSPTLITPGQVITAAEARGIGWMAWAWDDPASNVTDDSFALSYTGDYTKSADLTTYGKDVVENSTYGLLRLGQVATSF